MKRTVLMAILFAVLTLIQAETVDKIIARVGSDIILLSDLSKQINQMKSAKLYTDDMNESIVLGQMIESRLIIQKAKELNYVVDEEKIKTAAEKQIRQIKARFASEEEYTRELRKMKLTNSDLLKYFIDSMTERALTEQFYQKQIAIKVMISDKEMQDFYDANKDTLAVKPVTWKIGMILRNVQAGEATDKAQLDAIKAIQARLQAGEDFAALAKAESQCPSAEKGGDLGFFSRGMMTKPFDDAAFALKMGQVSDIVKTEYGYHLIKMEEKRGEEIRVSHILRLVQPNAADSIADKAQMESIRQEFLTKHNFEELATKWSMDEASAKDGGSIGEYGENDFPPLFAPVLMSLSVGSISEVLENEGLLYLFSKQSEVPSRMLSFEEVRSQIKDIITRQKQMQVYDNWINKLRQENHVEILL